LNRVDRMKCECPYDGMISKERKRYYSVEEKREGINHNAFECKCTNDLKYYIRAGEKICLCSKCVLPGDKEIN